MKRYYSLTKILKTNSQYNMIIGERSNGKTYAVLKYCVEQYFKTGKQFVYLRRWSTDTTPKRLNQLFTSLILDGVLQETRYDTITYRTGCFYLATYGKDGKPVYADTDCIGYGMSLNDNEHNKSISYPLVTTIVFDEFLATTYLPNEFMLLMNTISTIVRDRDDVKIFMLGNTVNPYSPYFDEFGIDVRKQKQGSINVYTYGKSDLKVAVEYTANTLIKKSNVYFAFDNPNLDMIKKGNWELGIYPHLPVKYNQKDIKFIYFILYGGDVFQCEIIKHDKSYFTYIHSKTTPLQDKKNDLVFTVNDDYRINYNNNIFKPRNQLEQKILSFFIDKKVFYQDNRVGNSISNFLSDVKKKG